MADKVGKRAGLTDQKGESVPEKLVDLGDSTYGLSDSPTAYATAVTPNDGADLTKTSRGIYVGGTGDLKIDTAGGDTITFVALVAGVIHPIRAKRVYSTGTTATSIVAVY